MELVINEGLYLDNEYLRRGTDIKCNVNENFSQYSEIFTPGIILTDHIIVSIFEEETRQCVKIGTYLGIWQLFVLANILKCPIMSVYPQFVQGNLRLYLHRIMLSEKDERVKDSNMAHIMWTSTRKDMRPINWIPNHYTALLPIDRVSDESVR